MGRSPHAIGNNATEALDSNLTRVQPLLEKSRSSILCPTCYRIYGIRFDFNLRRTGGASTNYVQRRPHRRVEQEL